MSQQAVAQDVAAKIVCDNLQALTALTAHTALKPLLPLLLRGGAIGRKLGSLLRNLLALIARRTYRHRENLSKPRAPRQKTHKSMTPKNC